MLSLDSQLDFPVDKAAAELQKIITDLRVENGRLNGALVKKEQLLDDFKADMEKMQDESSQLKRKNLFLAGDTKSRKDRGFENLPPRCRKGLLIFLIKFDSKQVPNVINVKIRSLALILSSLFGYKYGSSL